jgi:hypothetical protein
VSFPCCKLLIKYVLDVTMTVYEVAYIRECHSLVEVVYIRDCHSLVEVACIRECHSLVDSSQGFLEHGELHLIACHCPTAESVFNPR